jgi:hypothetical protein
MTSTDITALIHMSGAVLAVDSANGSVQLGELPQALVDTQECIALEMQNALESGTHIRQSFFGTDVHNICTYRLDDEHLVAVIFGQAVKEGQVWYYLRDAVARIQRALEAEEEKPEARPERRANDLIELIDQYFQPRDRARAGQPANETTPKAPAPEAAEPTPRAEPETEPEPPPDPAGPAAAEQLDWDTSTDATWEELAAGTDQGFQGLSYQDAMEQGLLPLDPLEEGTSPPPPPSPEELAAVEEIDWEIETDLDWEEIAEDTDQGFSGMTLQEARRRGLIDGIDADEA